MKKNVRRLSLNRETLRSLDPSTLSGAAGGTFTRDPEELDSHFDHTCGSVCDIPSWHYC
jgi:hypothetical protein